MYVFCHFRGGNCIVNGLLFIISIIAYDAPEYMFTTNVSESLCTLIILGEYN